MAGWAKGGGRRLPALAVCVATLAVLLSIQAEGAQDALPANANTTCPVRAGEPVNARVHAEYKGVRVYFCCEKCLAKFQKSPDTYAANVPALAALVAGAAGAADAGRDVSAEGKLRQTEARESPKAAGDGPRTDAASPTAPNWMTEQPAARFAGRLHVIAVHFPIALLIGAGLIELVAACAGRARPSRAARACVVLGAIGAAMAAGAGWIDAENTTTEASLAGVLWWHRWLGVVGAGAAMLTVALLGLATAAKRIKYEAPAPGEAPEFTSRAAPLAAYRLSLLLTAVLVGVSANFGGRLVYGDTYFTDAIRGIAGAPAASPPPGARTTTGGREPGPASEAAAVYEALFATSDRDLMIKRRNARLALLPPLPAVPPATLPANNEVDRFIAESWRRAGLPEGQSPPPLCDDATFARRVYLDVIGVVPTRDESAKFLSDQRPDKRDRLVDELLARSGDYADHWTPFWQDALGSSPVALRGGVPTRGDYTEFIREAFGENRPYDLFAAQLIDPGMPGHQAGVMADANGRKSRVQYVLNETHTDTLQTAAAVAQVFMGTAMKCASCHSHFENEEWPQARFLAFAGLFRDRDLEVIRCEKSTGQVVAARFAFDLPGAPADAPMGEDARLRRAAQLLTDPLNPRFAKAAVNRLWKRYVGLGLFEPADDFRLDRTSSCPDLLEWLAQDLMRHGYDLKRTIRLILTSRTYQLRYDPALEDHFDVAKPADPRYFRSPSLRRLTAEQLVDSVRVVLGQKLDPGARLYRDTSSTALSRALGKPAARNNEISTGRPDDAAVVQGLELLNGEEWQALTRSGRLVPMALAEATPAEAAELIYRAVLARGPTEKETGLVAGFLGESWTRPAQAKPSEFVWCDDEEPAGAYLTNVWKWTDSAPVSPASGTRVHMQDGMTEPRAQHLFLNAHPAMTVGPADTLFAYVYLDPVKPPREIMVQWNDGVAGEDWSHRAFWGSDEIPYGQAGTESRRKLGALPGPGKWVRLEIPAAEVGLGITRTRVVGMSFDQAGGTVYWDRSGVVQVPTPPGTESVSDLLWVLFTSPEFQYVH